MREAGAPVVAGLGVGLASSVFAGRAIQSLLYGVQAVDSGVMLTVCSLCAAAAFAAAFLPAKRAASVDPVETLRAE